MGRDSTSKHTCTLLRDGEVLREGLSIALDRSSPAWPELPTLTASFITEQYPPDFDICDQFKMVLDDGRSAEVFVSRISEVADGVYLVSFAFSSNLQ